MWIVAVHALMVWMLPRLPHGSWTRPHQIINGMLRSASRQAILVRQARTRSFDDLTCAKAVDKSQRRGARVCRCARSRRPISCKTYLRIMAQTCRQWIPQGLRKRLPQ